MLEIATQITFFLILAIIIGIVIGYLLAKVPTVESDEGEINNNMHVDTSTGIVSDDSLLNRGGR